MKEECADDVVGGADHAFSLAILGRGVRTRESIDNAVVRKEVT